MKTMKNLFLLIVILFTILLSFSSCEKINDKDNNDFKQEIKEISTESNILDTLKENYWSWKYSVINGDTIKDAFTIPYEFNSYFKNGIFSIDFRNRIYHPENVEFKQYSGFLLTIFDTRRIVISFENPDYYLDFYYTYVKNELQLTYTFKGNYIQVYLQKSNFPYYKDIYNK